VGVPFLLDYLKLPASYFDLYIISDVVTRKFKVLVQAMSFQTVTLILAYAIIKKFSFNLKRIGTALLTSGLLLAACLVVATVGLKFIVHNVYYENIVLMSMEISAPVPAKVWRSPPGPDAGQPPSGQGTGGLLSRIQRRGVLKVGYNAEALPFAFFNQKGDLVGYDIASAHRLARDLGVTLEFIPVTNATLNRDLDRDICDIVMSGVPITTAELGQVNFTEPYLDMNAAFITLDARKQTFRTQKAIRKIPHLRLAVTPANPPAERRQLQQCYPNAQLVELASIQDFFTHLDVADALLTTDKIGKAWALLSPKFGVATPHPVMFHYDLAYPVAITKGDRAFLDYLNQWLRLQKSSGAAQAEFAYWILGQTPLRHSPRWSISRNVLHWVK
jgi:ABC-type amino acid transport substrate-binding protein